MLTNENVSINNLSVLTKAFCYDIQIHKLEGLMDMPLVQNCFRVIRLSKNLKLSMHVPVYSGLANDLVTLENSAYELRVVLFSPNNSSQVTLDTIYTAQLKERIVKYTLDSSLPNYLEVEIEYKW